MSLALEFQLMRSSALWAKDDEFVWQLDDELVWQLKYIIPVV